MLSQLTGEKETDSSLNLSRGDRLTLVVSSETAGLGGDALKDIVNEGIHDSHGLIGDTSVGVDLLENLRGEGGEKKVLRSSFLVLQRLRKM